MLFAIPTFSKWNSLEQCISNLLTSVLFCESGWIGCLCGIVVGILLVLQIVEVVQRTLVGSRLVGVHVGCFLIRNSSPNACCPGAASLRSGDVACWNLVGCRSFEHIVV